MARNALKGSLPETKSRLQFRYPEFLVGQRQFLIAGLVEPEGSQAIGVAIKHDVIRHLQDLFVNLPFGRWLTWLLLGLTQIFHFGARRQQFDNHKGANPFLPDNITETEIGLIVQTRHTQRQKPVRALVPEGMAKVVVKVEVGSRKKVVSGIGAEAKRGTQQLGLQVMILIRQTGFLWIFTGKIVHGRQGFFGRQPGIRLGSRKASNHRQKTPIQQDKYKLTAQTPGWFWGLCVSAVS